MNVAVRDLAAATEHWRARLGFSVKPGRVHPNSLDNNHLKFGDGTEVELITAAEPADALAARYLDLLARRDGGAFLALRPDSAGALARRLADAGIEHGASTGSYFEMVSFPASSPLRYLFFIVITQPPVDLPEHLAHRNGGWTLEAAWIRKRDFTAEERMLDALGYRVQRGALLLPGGTGAHVVPLERGALYLIEDPDADDDRPVAGVTVAVASRDEAARVLREEQVPAQEGADPRGRWLRIEPARANGVWLELLEVIPPRERAP